MVCKLSVLLYKYTMKFFPVLAHLAFAVRLLPHHSSLSAKMSCPVSCLFSRYSELSLLPLFFSLPSFTFCCLGSFGWALNSHPLPTIADSLLVFWAYALTHTPGVVCYILFCGFLKSKSRFVVCQWTPLNVNTWTPVFGDRGTQLCPPAHRKGLLGCDISKPWWVLVAKAIHARSLKCSIGVGFGLEAEPWRGNAFFGSSCKSSSRHAGCAFSRWLFLVASPLLPVCLQRAVLLKVGRFGTLLFLSFCNVFFFCLHSCSTHEADC